MKKLLMIIVLIINCISTLCFAEEISKKPFLNFNKEEYDEGAAIRYTLGNDIVMPLYRLSAKLINEKQYEAAIACLRSQDLINQYCNDLFFYVQLRGCLSKYIEKSTTNLDYLINYLEKNVSTIPGALDTLKGVHSETDNRDCINLTGKGIAEIEKILVYYVNQLKSLKEYKISSSV